MEFTKTDMVKVLEYVDNEIVNGYRLEPVYTGRKLDIYVIKDGEIECIVTLSQVSGDIKFKNCSIDVNTKIAITDKLSEIISEL